MAEKDDTLQKEIDNTAIRLLQKSAGADNAEEGTTALLKEQVQAFSAVVEWYKIRTVHKPPETAKGSKFDGLKQRFSGSEAGGRGATRRRKGSADPAAIGTDSGPVSDDGADESGEGSD